jgi:hypothetical protein
MAFNKDKVKPDTKARSDEGLSSQPQFSDYEKAKVSSDPEPHEVAETIPPAGPSTIQTRGVATTGKPSANQDDAGATAKKS